MLSIVLGLRIPEVLRKTEIYSNIGWSDGNRLFVESRIAEHGSE